MRTKFCIFFSYSANPAKLQMAFPQLPRNNYIAPSGFSRQYVSMDALDQMRSTVYRKIIPFFPPPYIESTPRGKKWTIGCNLRANLGQTLIKRKGWGQKVHCFGPFLRSLIILGACPECRCLVALWVFFFGVTRKRVTNEEYFSINSMSYKG